MEKEVKLREFCLGYALQSLGGGKQDADAVVEAAKKFEAYINGNANEKP